MENRNENNVIKLKKDVVKNIAIVFLAIMLVLTFFSNSIMNKSLPEVATQLVQSGTITEKIRGTGTVEADDPYSVMVQETRKIASVAVKVGDEVERDQVLFYLEESESDELVEEQKKLDELILAYTTGALTGEMSDSAYKAATAGKVESMNTYEAQIEAAKNRIKVAEETKANLQKQKDVAGSEAELYSEGEINQLESELKVAEGEFAPLEEKYLKLKAIVEAGDGNLSSAEADLEQASLVLSPLKTDYEAKRNALYEAIKNTTDMALVDELVKKYRTDDSIAVNGENLADIILGSEIDIRNAEALLEWYTRTNYSEFSYDTFVKSNASFAVALADYNSKQDAYNLAYENAADYTQAKSEYDGVEAAYLSAKSNITELQLRIINAENGKSANSAETNQLINGINIQLIDVENELTKAQDDYSQLLTDISKTLDLTNQSAAIKEQQEKVNKLKENAAGTVVTSPVTGTIISIAKTAGETTTTTDPIATIQVAGKAMTMNFAVTTEQAAKVRVGDEASLQNSWYYNEMRITLTKIANDPNNPGKSKLLMFNIDGEVTNGETLSVTLGQRAREYNMVVPNSAIREDNRGKFILTVEEKSTPFGNRYKARRADVEVLTSDDNNTAINADIDSWSYVITTSNKPIEQGQQVRLSDR